MDTITVEIHRNYISLFPFIMNSKKNDSTCFALERKLSVYNIDNKGYKFYLDSYDSKNKILRIPIGFGVQTIIDLFNNDNVFNYDIINKNEEYHKPSICNKFNLNFNPRDKTQQESIDFLLNDEGYNKLLTLNVGNGKTYCAINAINETQHRALIISYNLSEQWVERILQYTDIKESEIYCIRGKDSINHLLKSKRKYRFYIASTVTISTFIKNGGCLNKLIEHMDVGVKVIDEVHSLFKQNMLIESMSDTKYNYFLTATPMRTDKGERNIFNRLFLNIPSYGYHTHQNNNYYVLRLVNYDTNPNYTDIKSCIVHITRFKKFFQSSRYFDYIFRNHNRKLFYFSMIKYLLDKLFDNKPKSVVAIMMAKLDHIVELKEFIENNDDQNRYSVGNYTTSVKKEFRKKELEKNIIISTLASLKEGVDIPGLNAIFCGSSFTSDLINRQLIGRMRKIENDVVYIYDFLDLQFKDMERQRKNRLNEYGSRVLHTVERFISENDVIDILNKVQ